FESFLSPGVKTRLILQLAHNAGNACSNGSARRPSPSLGVLPCDINVVQVAILITMLSERSDDLVNIVIHIANPCHFVAAYFDNDPANLLEKLQFILHMHKCIIALPECVDYPVGLEYCFFGLLAFVDVSSFRNQKSDAAGFIHHRFKRKVHVMRTSIGCKVGHLEAHALSCRSLRHSHTQCFLQLLGMCQPRSLPKRSAYDVRFLDSTKSQTGSICLYEPAVNGH